MKTLMEFLNGNSFVVLTRSQKGRKRPQHEAWGYKGPLDFHAATPQRFGLGSSPMAALEALDWQLHAMTKASPAPMASSVSPTQPTRSDRAAQQRPVLTDRELATVLAALRFYQEQCHSVRPTTPNLYIQDIVTNGDVLEPLTAEEIDSLCHKFNTTAA
jgi:hypothetical protein